jgi:hypothetical protein
MYLAIVGYSAIRTKLIVNAVLPRCWPSHTFRSINICAMAHARHGLSRLVYSVSRLLSSLTLHNQHRFGTSLLITMCHDLRAAAFVAATHNRMRPILYGAMYGVRFAADSILLLLFVSGKFAG